MTFVVAVRIFRADLGDAELAALCATLDAAESARAAAFRKPEDRRRFVVGRSQLRRLAAERLGVPAAALRFVEGAHGKPEVAGASIGTNVSHSGDVVAVALADGPVGVDVELRRDLVDLDALVRAKFADEEAQAVRAAADPRREFFRIWAAKEAVVKAIGDGLTLGLKNFVVPPFDTAPRAVRAAGAVARPTEFGVAALPTPDGYAGAVAALGVDWHVDVRSERASPAAG